MKFTLKYLLLLVYWTSTANFRRLTKEEMIQKIEESEITANEEVQQCLPALRGELFPNYDFYYYTCTVDDAHENETIFSYVNQPNETSCSNFICWESQLTEITRLDLLDAMNNYRQTVATGECDLCRNIPRLVFELVWNKELEREASAELENCPQENYVSNFNQNNTEKNKHLVVTSFKMLTVGQIEMRTIFRELISANRLKEWDTESNNYKTGLMLEVGCSFVLRSDVDDGAVLGKRVSKGNIGHLACIYTSTIENTISPRTKASNSTCSEVLSEKSVNPDIFYYSNSSYYSSLCKVDRPFFENFKYDICWGPRNDVQKFCGNNMTATWSEKFYGLTLRHRIPENGVEAECNLPPKQFPRVKPKIVNAITYNCTKKHEVLVNADSKKCPDWSCQDSQLTDSSKYRILYQLNKFRNLIAAKNCSEYCGTPCKKCSKSYCNVATLKWHWYLEWQAAKTVSECSTVPKISRMRVFRNSPFPKSTIFEEIVLHFNLETTHQQFIIDQIVKTLFWENGFDDWLKDGETFKRGNTLWIGCAFIVRPHIPRTTNQLTPAHLVCIYAAITEIRSLIGDPKNETCCEYCLYTEPCPVKYSKNISPYKNLCSPVHFEVEMSCQAREGFCPLDFNQSRSWTRGYYAEYLFQNLNGSFAQGVHFCLTCEDDKNPYHVKYCYILQTILIILLAVLCLILALMLRYKIEKDVFNRK